MSWRLWAKALGEKTGKNEKEADIIALIRTVIVFSYIATNAFIVAGVIRHWDASRHRDVPLCIRKDTQRMK